MTGLQAIFIWLWGVWVALFCAIEFIALYLRKWFPDNNVTRNGGTLSEVIWSTIRGYQWYHRVLYALFVVAWGLLTYHFFLG